MRGMGFCFLKVWRSFVKDSGKTKYSIHQIKLFWGYPALQYIHISQIWFVRKSTNAEVLFPPPVIFNILINLWFNAVRNVPAAKFIPIGPIIYCPAAKNSVLSKEKCLLLSSNLLYICTLYSIEQGGWEWDDGHFTLLRLVLARAVATDVPTLVSLVFVLSASVDGLKNRLTLSAPNCCWTERSS